MCKSKQAADSGKSKPGAPCVAGSTCPADISKCVVHFRPLDAWNGEYGFDWLRIGGAAEMAGEVAYKTDINAAFKAGDANGYNANDAYGLLKANEYENLAVEIEAPPETPPQKEYFVTYLNLFPPDAPTVTYPSMGISIKPVSEVELKVIIDVRENSPEVITLLYAGLELTLSEYTLSDKGTPGSKKVATDILKITCNSEFSTAQEIKVISLYKGVTSTVGKIIIAPNDAASRKDIKVVMSNVKTNIVGNGGPATGSFSLVNVTNLVNVLHQSLFNVTLIKAPDLDLTNPNIFVNHAEANDYKSGTPNGRHIYTNTGPLDTNRDKGIIASEILLQDLRRIFLNDKLNPGNAAYSDQNIYFTAFSFGIYPSGQLGGMVENIGVHNFLMFAPCCKTTCFAHESLHGLGLYHTHNEKKIDGITLEPPHDAGQKYLFKYQKTDNIMSYSEPRKSTWRWQWKMANPNYKG